MASRVLIGSLDRGLRYVAAGLGSRLLSGSLTRGVKYEVAGLGSLLFSGSRLRGVKYEAAGLGSRLFKGSRLRGVKYEAAGLGSRLFIGSLARGVKYDAAGLGSRLLSGSLVRVVRYDVAGLGSRLLTVDRLIEGRRSIAELRSLVLFLTLRLLDPVYRFGPSVDDVEDFVEEDGVPYLLRFNFFSVDDVVESFSLDSLLLTDVDDPYLLVYESFSLGSLMVEYLLVYVSSFSFGSFAEAMDEVYERVYVAGVDVVVVLVDVVVAVLLADDGTTGVSRFALRYVPPEYDGLYDEGDVSVPKRGVALAESLLVTSSRDEYCNKTKQKLY